MARARSSWASSFAPRGQTCRWGLGGPPPAPPCMLHVPWCLLLPHAQSPFAVRVGVLLAPHALCCGENSCRMHPWSVQEECARGADVHDTGPPSPARLFPSPHPLPEPQVATKFPPIPWYLTADSLVNACKVGRRTAGDIPPAANRQRRTAPWFCAAWSTRMQGVSVILPALVSFLVLVAAGLLRCGVLPCFQRSC